MNTITGNYPAEMRVSDADRDAALSELSEHFQAGRLTAAEFDDRAGRALAARTWGELRNLLHDLPTALSGPQTGAPKRPSGRPALIPAAVLIGIGIAVALSVGVGWGAVGLLFAALFIARRVIRCAGASRPTA